MLSIKRKNDSLDLEKEPVFKKIKTVATSEKYEIDELSRNLCDMAKYIENITGILITNFESYESIIRISS